jgi:Tfp pilus assembly protein PilN
MKAINLIPADARRGGGSQMGRSGGAVYVVLAVLAAALVLVVVYVLTTNTISDRKAKASTLQAQADQAQAEAARLAPYTTFAQLAQARAETIRQLASNRFDWHRSLTDLSKVVPANTSLQSLTATVSPGAGGGGIALRSAIPSPAFEMTGCTASQDDVARLISRLRVMHGVTRVSLQDSQKADGGQPGTGLSTTTASSSSGQGCGANAPQFHIVVFFQPIPGASAAAAPAGAPQTVANPATTAGAARNAAVSTTTGGTK